MLWFGGILCFIVYGISLSSIPDNQTLALAIVLILVIFVTSIFQSFQEGKSDKVIDALKALSASEVLALRDGAWKDHVPADELVPGDIVKVKGGEKVPADVRVLVSSELKVNNASLTGENVDIKLGTEANHEKLYEAKNIARSGCNFTNGTATCVVFLTGDDTFFGEIAKSTTQIERPDTLIKYEIHRLIKFMAVIAFSLGIAFFILAKVKGYSWITAIVFAIGIIVANVPEGLLPQMTVALTLTAQRMLKMGILVSNLEIIETLGAVTVICSDKTGTLTCNRMTVAHVMYNMTIHTTPETTDLDEDKAGPKKIDRYDKDNKSFELLRRVTTLNTDAVFLDEAVSPDGIKVDVLKRKVKGDASEAAMIKFVHPFRDITEWRSKCPMKIKIPFNSSNKWMVMCTEAEGDSQAERDAKPLHLMMKGAPDRVWNRCSHVIGKDGERIEMTDAVKKQVEALNSSLAKRGERVLAFATQVRRTFPLWPVLTCRVSAPACAVIAPCC